MLKKVSEDDRCIGCPMCRLFPNNTLVEPQVGLAPLLFVGEAAGEQEALLGKPFVGGAGRWLNSLMRNAHINRDDVNIINVINCRPPDNLFPDSAEARSYISREAADKAIAHCLDKHVTPFIKSRNWDKIILLGDKALRYIGKKLGGILRWRGSPIEFEVDGKTYSGIATLHPSFLARDQALFPVVVNDLQKSLQKPPEYYNLTPSLEDVRNFTATEFAFDIETKGWSKQITMVGLSDKPYHCLVVPFEGGYIPELRRIFMNAERVICQNGIGFDLNVLLPQLGLEW